MGDAYIYPYNLNSISMNWKKFLCSSLYVLFLFSQLNAQDTLRTYIFGNSLVNHELVVHPIPTQENSAPHWFHFLAQEAGYHYEVSGQYGFLSGHATSLPPIAQWGFDSVPAAWNDYLETFDDADFSNILITPANFTQWQPPFEDYYGDTLSPISASQMLIDWCNLNEDSLDIYLYEGWPDMAPYLGAGFPPTPAEWNSYNNYLNNDYHDWYLELQDSLMEDYPGQCVRMIPVAPIISTIYNTAPFNSIPIDTLYEDDAPHGRPTTYFLAGLITYMAMYEEPAPMSYVVTDSLIDTTVANNYADIVNLIWNELLLFNDSLGNSRVFCTTPLATQQEIDQEIQVRAYPNPTTGLLQIRIDQPIDQLELLDLNGRQVPVIRSGPSSLDLSGLAAGMYFLRIRSRDQQLVSRIIKE